MEHRDIILRLELIHPDELRWRGEGKSLVFSLKHLDLLVALDNTVHQILDSFPLFCRLLINVITYVPKGLLEGDQVGQGLVHSFREVQVVPSQVKVVLSYKGVRTFIHVGSGPRQLIIISSLKYLGC